MKFNKHQIHARLLRRLRKTIRRLARYCFAANGRQTIIRAIARLKKRLAKLTSRLNPLRRPLQLTLPALALWLGTHQALQAQTPIISSVGPQANDPSVVSTANIQVVFNTTMKSSSITGSTIRIYGSQSGFLSASGVFSGNSLRVFDPDVDFKANETISITVTTDAESSGGDNLAAPEVWRFRAGVERGSGLFKEVSLTAIRRSAIALGDLDGDGDIDAIAARESSNTQEILLNNGDASFSSTSLGGRHSRDIVLDDFNGDGALDAVIANENIGLQEIWLGNGDGTFATSAIGGSDSFGVASGDLDGDGDQDVVIANDDDQSQKIWLNNGDGSFSISSFGGGKSRGVAIGDLDGDQDLDVIISNRGNSNNAQEIWLNNGDGTFTSSSFGGGNSRRVALGDLDDDGDLDAIIANYNEAQEVWLNNGNASFQSFTFGAGKSEDVALGDLDADGDLDAVIANYNEAQEIWINDGEAAFSSRDFGGGKSRGVDIADLDGDGDLDVFLANYSTSSQSQGSLWLNFSDMPEVVNVDPAANASAAPRNADIVIEFDDSMDNSTLTTATLPWDGNLIVRGRQSGYRSGDAVISYGGKSVTINPAADFYPGEKITVSVKEARNSLCAPQLETEIFSFRATVEGGSGVFSESTFDIAAMSDVTLGDLDGDGDLDAVLTSDSHEHHIWLNNGDGSFTSSAFGNGQYRRAELGDLDGDGDLDVIQIAYLSNTNAIWLNNGDATFSSSRFGGNSNTKDFDLGDLDGDGDLDVLFANQSNSFGNEMWLNNGDGSFATSSFHTGISQAVAIGDLDGDGDLDALIGSKSGEAHEIWLNNGDASFSIATFADGGILREIVLGDLDGDGDLDALTALATGQGIWINNGDASFSSSSAGSYDSRGVELGDLDGDGDLDAVISNRDNPQEIWLNNGDASFAVRTLGSGRTDGLDIGDLDGDGDLDVVIAHENVSGETKQPADIWFNQSPPKLVSTLPSENDIDVAHNASITLNFDKALDAANFAADTPPADGDVIVYGRQSGFFDPGDDFTFFSGDTKVRFEAATSFRPGEEITVTVKDAPNTKGETMPAPYSFGFRAAVDGGSGEFLERAFHTDGSRDVALGDLDGDGDLDALIVQRHDNNHMHLWLNNGDGSFASSTLQLVTFAQNAALGDLDADGDLDAVVSQGGGFTNLVFWNNGDATFSTASIGSNSNTRGLALGDLDGDGHLDVIFASQSNKQQLIWYNNGDGSFNTAVFGTHSSNDVALGDLDSDGDLDAIIANGDDQAQEIWLNNGDRSFTSSTFGGGNSKGVALGDLDGDGDLDAVVTNSDGLSGQEIWLNNGDASFASSSYHIANAVSVAFGDLDDDKDLDVILANSNEPQSIWFNNGDATFTSSSGGNSTGSSTGLALGDLDGDGDLDAIITNHVGSNPHEDEIWINREAPRIISLNPTTNSNSAVSESDIDIVFSEWMQSTTVVTAVDPADATILVHGSQSGNISTNAVLSATDNHSRVNIDLAGAFKPGELITLTLSGIVSVEELALPKSLSSFRAATAPASGFFAGPTFSGGNQDVDFGDLDGDGDLDAFVVNSFSQDIWLNNGDGTFASNAVGTSRGVAAALGDLDGDGDLDAVVANESFNRSTIWLNNGDASFVTSEFGQTDPSADVALGDLDGDGFLDVIVLSGTNSAGNELWLNNGDASFSSSEFSTRAEAVEIGDLDGDGDLDFVLADADFPNELWLNNGDASFASSTLGSDDNRDVAIGDLDGDGDLDMIFAKFSADGAVLHSNNGDASFSISTLPGSDFMNAVKLGDIDGDGDLDAILGANLGEPIALLNIGAGAFVQRSVSSSRRTRDLDLGDLNGDGVLDLVLANYFSTSDILLGQPTPLIVDVDPQINAVAASTGANIEIEFSVPMDTATLRSSTASTKANLFVYSAQSGQITTQATISYASGNTIVVIDPAESFKPGEEIMVTVTGAQSAINAPLANAYVFAFRAAAQSRVGDFSSSTFSGSQSQGVAVGDLDGDGDLDAVIANDADQAQEIWLNEGRGCFTTDSFGAGNSRDIALGDLDGDGDLDAVVANYVNQAQEIWLNNGDATFSSSTLASGSSTGVALGDLDGDGDLDVAIANGNNLDSELWLNNGDASFSTSDAFDALALDLALGDLDGDGDLDAVFAKNFGQAQEIWFNQGDASFVKETLGGGFSRGLALGDLDGDGDLDAIVANDNQADEIWLNNGDGSFTSSSFGASGSRDVRLGDLDGDGDLDAIIAKHNAAEEIWTNNGDGSFSSSSFGSAAASTALAIGDLDGDGVLDIIVANGGDNRNDIWFSAAQPRVTAFSPSTHAIAVARDADIVIDFSTAVDSAALTSASIPTQASLIVYGMQSGYLNTTASISSTNGDTRIIIDPAAEFYPGEQIDVTIKDITGWPGGGLMKDPVSFGFRAAVDGGPATFNLVALSGGDFPVAARFGDLDGDGDLDIFLANNSYEPSNVLLNNGDGSFVTVANTYKMFGTDVALGDLDGDGDLDALIVSGYGEPALLYVNDGSGSFSESEIGGRLDRRGVEFGDLDSDGDLDVVVANYGGGPYNGGTEIWLNEGNLNFTQRYVGGDGASLDAAVGDLDKDGDLDLVIVNKYEAHQLLLNNGDGIFNDASFGPIGGLDIALGDLDSDGDLDFVVANKNQAQELWLNNGDATFASSLFGDVGSDSQGADFGDVDGDGDLDVIVANKNQAQELWLNNGDATFTSTTIGTGQSVGLTMGDVDGDGDLDALVVNRFGSPMELWFNHPTLQITNLSPSTNANAAPRDGDVVIEFNDAVDASTVTGATITTNANLILFASQTGHITTSASITLSNGNTRVIIDPAEDFRAGEEIALTIRDVRNELAGLPIPAPVVHSFRAAVDAGSALFAPRPLALGTNTNDIAFGDFDGDGDLDFVTSSYTASESRVFLNYGDGSFTPQLQTFNTWTNVAAGDLNGDGKLDIIASGNKLIDNLNVEVLLNNGDGSFALVGYKAPSFITDIELGDLDGDGDLDAIASSDLNNKITLLLNKGDGFFCTSAITPAVAGFGGHEIGDLDNDGDLDLVVAVYNGPQALFFNNGDASFQHSSLASASPNDLDMGDFDGDGDLDLVTVDENGPDALWFNNGDGSFSSSSFVSGINTAIAVGDLDADGDLDFMTANQYGIFYGESNQLWLNNGDGSFSSSSYDSVSSTIAEMGDLDGDGDLDLVLFDDSNTTALWFNLAPPLISAVSPNSTTASLAPATIEVRGAELGALDVQLSTLDEFGVTSGSIAVPVTEESLSSFTADLPAGALATRGTLTLTVTTPAGSTSTSLTVLNDRPVITTTQSQISIAEDQSRILRLSLGDASPGIDGLTVIPPAADLTTIASITQISATAATTEFRIVPVTNVNGSVDLTFRVSDGELESSTSISIVVDPVNDPPTIATSNTAVTTQEDTPVALPFALADIDTPFANLILTATSANQSLLPNAGLSFGATGATTTLFVDPATNANGTAPITVFVNDGEFLRSTSFNLTVNPVNDPPLISTNNTAVSTDEDTPVVLTFVLDDIDTPFANLLLSATSSDPSLIADSGLSLGATGATTSLFIDPSADANGQADITVTVDDGISTSSTTFTVKINPVDDPPLIRVANNLVHCNENGATSLSLSLSDIDTPVVQLQITANSADPSLLDNGGISLSATAATMSLTLIPECGRSGMTEVALTVSDAESSHSTNFTLNVLPVTLRITGATCACPNIPLTYTAEPGEPTASHDWTVSGGTIISGQGSGSVQVVWEQNTSASLTVVRTPLVGCSSSTLINFTSKELIALMDYYHATAANLPVADNDLGPALTLQSVGQPYGGTASIVDGELRYEEDEGFAGLEILPYIVDSDACRSTGAVVIAVEGAYAPVNTEYLGMVKDRVDGVRGLRGAYAVAVAPDGRFAYVAGRSDHSIAIFERKLTTASLEYQGRAQNNAGGVKGIKYVMDLAISPDGRHLYAAGYGDNAVAVFAINSSTGALSFLESIKQGQTLGGETVDGLTRPRALTISPDGRNVYVNAYSGHSLAVFQRLTNGRLLFLEHFKDGVDGVDGLRSAIDVAVSPDGTSVYTTGYGDHALVLFSRSLVDGRLRYEERYKEGSGGIDGLAGAIAVAISPDGRHVYAAGKSDDALALFKRDVSTGTLSYVKRYKDGVSGVDGLNGVRNLLVCPDGRHVWAAGTDDNAVALFDRDPASGELSWREMVRDGVDGVEGLNQVIALASDPLSEWILGAAYRDYAVATLFRNRVPVAVSDNEGNIAVNATATIAALDNDTDPDEHILTITQVSGATLGTATIAGGGAEISYSAGAATGVESIDYTISDGHGGESTATVSISLVLPKQGTAPLNWTSLVTAGSAITDLALRPNPVVKQGRIELSLSRAVELRIAIADVHGRLLTTIEEREFSAGRHSLLWQAGLESGARLAAGSYLLLVEEWSDDGESQRLSLPFVLLK